MSDLVAMFWMINFMSAFISFMSSSMCLMSLFLISDIAFSMSLCVAMS